MLMCPGCERPNGKAARFCLYCGYRFHVEPAADAGSSSGVIPMQRAREKLVCDNCSAPLHDLPNRPRLHCDYCGSTYSRPGGSAPNVVIIQNDSSPGAFETGSSPGDVAGAVIDELLSNSGRRGWGYRERGGDLFRFGTSGCVVALALLPVHLIFDLLFRRR